MALITEPTYSTLTQFKTYTPIASQDSISDGDWSPTGIRAQYLIDTYVRTDLKLFVSTQDSVFPIGGSDGVIPDDVTLAHIELTSYLIDKGEPSFSDLEDVSGESWSGTGYSKSFHGKKDAVDPMVFTMPPIVRRLLKKWSAKTFSGTY